MTDLSVEQQTAKTWEQPAGSDLAAWMQTRIARYETRA